MQVSLGILSRLHVLAEIGLRGDVEKRRGLIATTATTYGRYFITFDTVQKHKAIIEAAESA